MNKADITIARIRKCKDIGEAMYKVRNSLKEFGYKLNCTEQSFCFHYAELFFGRTEVAK